jgi:hypothetical protein
MTNEESLLQCRRGYQRLVEDGVCPPDAREHYFVCAYLNGYASAMMELQERRDYAGRASLHAAGSAETPERVK